MRLLSADTTETEQIGADLAGRLSAGDVVLLSGELGAGKTTLVRGAARALGVSAAVTSPTFAIGNRYLVDGRPTVSHLDLYRLGDLGAEDPDLLADYIAADRIAFVEWPGGAEREISQLGHIRFRVRLDHAGGDQRTVDIDAA